MIPPSLPSGEGATRIQYYWIGAGLAVITFASLLAALSASFGYDREVADMPVFILVTTLVLAGLLFAAVIPRLIRNTDVSGIHQSPIVIIIASAGLVARLILFASEPALEDDYQRYLWDGAVTAAGLNPYAASPQQAMAAAPQSALRLLTAKAGLLPARINHPNLATIYPPVSQAAFAIAHWIHPWSLTAWRALLLVCDCASLVMLLILLESAGRSRLWAALYWWNPLVIKEGFNSAHIEPLVIATMLMALLLAVRQRPVPAAAMLSVAAGTKIWPLLLLPLIVRPLLAKPRRFISALVIFASLLAIWMSPIALAGFGEQSGFRAYAENWKTNSALFPVLESLALTAFRPSGWPQPSIVLGLKAVLAMGVAACAVWVAWRPIKGPQDLMIRAGTTVALLVLVSPAQYPWYIAWAAPFLAFFPSRPYLLLCAMVPLYYASFHFAARETLEIAGPFLVASIWLPVWLMLFYDARSGLTDDKTHQKIESPT